MEVLREEKILEETLAERLKGWVGLRNVLVHFSIDIDHGKVYDIIENELGDIEEFLAGMSRLLKDS